MCLLPLGIYVMVLCIFRNVGKGILCLFPIIFFLCFPDSTLFLIWRMRDRCGYVSESGHYIGYGGR